MGKAFLNMFTMCSRAALGVCRRPARFFSSKPSNEVAFAWITPKAMAKSLEGAILARMLSTPGVQLVGARMYSPSSEMVSEYAERHRAVSKHMDSGTEFHKSMNNFITTELDARLDSERGYPNWMMLLLFKGPNARESLKETIGLHVPNSAAWGNTIRGAFGDYATDRGVFQPAVVSAYTYKSNIEYLKLFAKYADTDGGRMENWWEMNDGDTDDDGTVDPHQLGMIMIKPDNMTKSSSLPGHIIDLISTTGLHCRGCKVVNMSVGQASEFYGFLEPIFTKKLAKVVEKRLRNELNHDNMGFWVTDDQFGQLTDVLKGSFARSEVNSIIEYMSGIDPEAKRAKDRDTPGPARCFALLYSGENSIDMIRKKLGATNPGEAEEGSVRADYGRDVMKNGCHASDSDDSVIRECKIIGLTGDEPAPEKKIINEYLESVGEL